MSLAGSDSSLDGLPPGIGSPKGSVAPRSQSPSSPASRNSAAMNVSQVWLDGDVLSCACPDCGAPMAIRLWLGLAECRMCGAQVELTEEQEREAQRLLETRAAPPPAAAAPAATNKVPPAQPPAPPPLKTQAPASQRPAPARPVERLEPPRLVAIPVIEAPPPPQPTVPTLLAKSVPIAAPPVAGTLRRTKSLSRTLLESIISCLVSLLVHLALVIALGMWFFEKPAGRTFVLKADFRMATAAPLRQAEPVIEAKPKEKQEEPAPPVVPKVAPPPPKQPSKPQKLEMKERVAELVVAPSVPPANLFAAGVVSPGSMFAGRDPRLRGDIVRREGGTDRTERAVALGLKWLAEHQEPTGAWSLDRFHQTGRCNGECENPGLRSNTAATALGLLPFLGAGHTQHGGEYQQVVRRGLDQLLDWQRTDGSFEHIGGGNMYAHGLATIALCEAYALTRERKLRDPAQRAIDFIVAAQHRGGGWRYSPGESGDLSVVGWQLMALRSAQNAYLTVPEETLERGKKFLDTVQTSTKRATFSYMPSGGPTLTMTAEGLLSRLYNGSSPTEPALLAGADYLLDDHLPTVDDVNMYYWYYGTQAMHHLGGERWTRWNNRMREVLVDLQVDSGHAAGSWTPGGHHDGAGGRLYTTALAVCTLEVYYRHMPLYRSYAAPKPTPPATKPGGSKPTSKAQLR